MKRINCFKVWILILTIFGTGTLYGINTTDTRMLSQPAVSKDRIAFIYAEDLWVANMDGTNPKRLTVDEGIESDPMFSPDGRIIAFSAQYDGNTDVFTIPADGGVPKRLTWHPGNDIVRGFSPDGANVLFTSPRSAFTSAYLQFYLVPVAGGYPVQLDIPAGYSASFSSDGKSLAYTPVSPAYQQWKNYRGGRISKIWICSLADHSIVKIPQPEGGCNDADPMWIDNTIFFISDRNGEFNLFSYDISSKEVRALTSFTDYPIIKAASGNKNIIFEQGGYLHMFDPAAVSVHRLKVGVAADLQELRPRFVQGTSYARSLDISPSGARAVFDIRGDIVTVPEEKGDPRNITSTPGSHEKYPSWSPDGKSIAWFSDVSGEYELHIKSQDGKGDPKIIKPVGSGFYAFPEWSPDSKKICYVDNSKSLYLADVQTGVIKKIDSDALNSPGPFRKLINDWSSDSRWILYTKVSDTYFKVVYLYSVDQQRSFPVSDGMSDASEPVFDPSGKYLYFFVSTDAGPVVNWFDLSTQDMRMTKSIYLVTLQKDTLSPFAKESDEEKIKEEKTEPAKPAGNKKKEAKSSIPEKTEPEGLKIDTEGLRNRIVNIPVAAGDYYNLGAGAAGEIYYIVSPSVISERSTIHKYDLKERKDSEIMEADNFIISADTKKMLYTKDQTVGITSTGKKPEPGKGILNLSAVSVKVDPAVEWPQMFDEAWRINRDYFYDPGMHGADWNAIKTKYSKFLPDLSCRSDLNRLIQWMCSELAVGHHRVSGGDRPLNPQRVGVGLLGADFSISGNRYQIKKIYGGLNWNPDLRCPLAEPGLNVNPGDYILAVNGKDLTADKNIFSYFENTDGKITELTIGSKPDYSGSRVIKVVPVGGEYSLRNRDWVEGNLKKVTEATNGQVAYVYVPNTSTSGHEYFKRYFFPQVNRKAVIVDERFNGGGLLADYYIDILLRPLQSYWNMRYGNDLKSPSGSIQGPKVMLVNEYAGSGGDMLPWMFRKFKVGTLVGTRTWGGLVGTLGFPELMDGGGVTAPNLAIWTEDGFIVENVGIAPDIEVEQLPAEIIKGRDPQLEKAIEVALKELEKNPQPKPVRPAYPVRVRR
ncbi:MAG TPA: PDZ domain-containing protein [Bacteroidales bacterium]|nr:PDZ domain-containing protein [Bacteroidales bacterium]